MVLIVGIVSGLVFGLAQFFFYRQVYPQWLDINVAFVPLESLHIASAVYMYMYMDVVVVKSSVVTLS